MSEWYSPDRQPPAARVARPGEPLWAVRVNHVSWSCDLRFQGESYGWEAQILRDGDLFAAHGAFPLREQAIGWADEQRRDIERGWTD